jgi:hypothetical protein
VLEGRGVSITRAQRATILGCEDPATLDRWLAGSVKVASVQELLAEAPKVEGRAKRGGQASRRAGRLRAAVRRSLGRFRGAVAGRPEDGEAAPRSAVRVPDHGELEHHGHWPEQKALITPPGGASW